MMRHVAANALTLLIVGLVVAFGIVTWGQSRFRAPGPLTAPVEIQVERGESLASVAGQAGRGGGDRATRRSSGSRRATPTSTRG